MNQSGAVERSAWDVRDWWIVAGLAALVTVAFADVLFFDRNFFTRDVYPFYYPTKKIIRDVVLGGHFPYWNPRYSGGQPMAANPEYEIFYPLQWLIFLPSYWLGFRLHALAHIYLAIGGAYAFLRSLDLRRASSVAGAISFALGGIVLSDIGILPCLFALAWAPLIALFARRYLLDGRRRDLAAASLSLGMQFLVGEPSTIVQTGFVLALATIFIGRFASSLRRAASMVAGGALIGCAQIVPTADFVRDSVRSWYFSFPIITTWSMPPARILELLHPTIMGSYADTMQWYWGGSLYGRGTPFYWSIYCGVTMAVLALAGLASPTRGRAFFLTASLSSVALALGAHTPLFGLLYDVRLARNLRFPEKFILMAVCATVVFGTVVFDRCLDRDRRTLRVAAGIAATLVVVSLSIAFAFSAPASVARFREIFHLAADPVSDYQFALATAEWWKEVLRLTFLVALLILLARSPRTAFAAWLLVAFVAIDVIPVSRAVAPSIGRELFSPPLTTRRPMRLLNDATWDGFAGLAKPFPKAGEGFYWFVRNGLLLNNATLSGFDTVIDNDYDVTVLVPTRRFVQSALSMRRSPQWPQSFATMADAAARATLVDPLEETRRIRGDWKRVKPVNLEAVRTAGRSYFADAAMTFRDDRDFAARAAAQVAPWTKVFVAEGERVNTSAGRIVEIHEMPDETQMNVVATGPAFLVRCVTNHRYWRAWVDGRPVRIIAANIAFQGVSIPPGAHTVVFRYRNPFVIPSAIVSLIAAAIAGTMILRRRGVAVPS